MLRSLVKVFEEVEENQVFGRKEVMKILECGVTNAGKVIGEMKELQIIQSVKGKGNGKYVFFISK